MTELVEMTDIQETFTFLHEASHYLVSITDDIKTTSVYRKLDTIFGSVQEYELDDDFYEECYCDYLSVTYLLNHSFHSTTLPHDMYFLLLFRTLTGVYIIQLADKCQRTQKEAIKDLQDEQMCFLLLQFGGLHGAIYEFITEHNPLDILLLSDTFENAMAELINLEDSFRDISYNIENSFIEDYHLIAGVDKGEMVDFIYEFLKLYRE